MFNAHILLPSRSTSRNLPNIYADGSAQKIYENKFVTVLFMAAKSRGNLNFR